MKAALRRLTAGAVLASAIALAAAATSSATGSIAVAGDVLPTSTNLTTRTAGDNLLFDGTGTHAWAGSLTGTSVVDVHFVVHPSGVVTYQGVVTFTGTTPCGTGTVRLNATGSGPFPGPLTGTSTTIDEGGASVPLHAELDTVLFLTPAGAVLTYSGEAHCW